MRLTFWRKVRFYLRRRRPPGKARGVHVPLLGRGAGRRDPLASALAGLQEAVDAGRLKDLSLAWFRVDEAKAAAARYDPERLPTQPAVLPQEQALAERVWRLATGRPVTAANLLRPSDDPCPMVRYRLLVARLPVWCAAGGERAADAVRACYELMHRSAEVLSPYGRYILARAVCQCARDREELARQLERFRRVTSDYQSPDGAAMMFVNGGDFDLPLPISLTEVLDWPGMPTSLDAFKREDAPREIQDFFMRLTPRGKQVFLKAFRRRQDAWRLGCPWRKPHSVASEGFVFVNCRIHVPAFFIDRRPVTNEMFHAFVREHPLWMPSRVSPFATDPDTYLPAWVGDRPTPGTLTDAVTGVSYQACRAYASAYGKQLPSEAQWVYGLIGAEVPETRYTGADARPSMTEEERAVHGRNAAERGLHLLLPERVFDFDGPARLASDGTTVSGGLYGPSHGSAHLWRSPTARGRVPDPAGDVNLTFRGVVPAGRVWDADLGRSSTAG